MSDTQKLEMICKKYSRVVHINKAKICTAKGRKQLYLNKIENRAGYKARGCKGQMRKAMVRPDEISHFMSSLA